MKQFFTLLAFCCAGQLLAASNPFALTVSGRIVDAELGLPLEFATVSAFAPDSSLVNGASTDSLGTWSLVLPKGEYLLKFEFIGYETNEQSLTVKSNLSLGTVSLNSSAVGLEGATVTAQRSQLTLKLDKQVFDVGADILSQGGSANEVLENVPSIDVSPTGEVSLRGNSGVRILINGKPSVLADNNALESIPAENIAKVEIMTAPSARYEASGTGGIINIVLKDKVTKTVGGRLGISVGAPVETRVNGSISATMDKWTVFGNGGLRYSEYLSIGEADRRSELPGGIELLREDLRQDRSDRAWNLFGGLEFRPAEGTAIVASYSHYYQLDDDLANVDYVYRDGDFELTRILNQQLGFRTPSHYNQLEATLNQDLPGKDRKLFVLFQNDFWNRDVRESNAFTETFPSGGNQTDLLTQNQESSNDFLLQADYEQPLGERGKLEVGLRGETRIIESDYLAETVAADGERSVFLDFDNQVDYFEQIGAAYVQYGYEGEKWGLQLGLRDEYTSIRIEQNDGSPDIIKRYNNIFPSATLSRKLTEQLSANLSYTSRIVRPGFWALNPFGGVSNPNEIELGNPDIEVRYVDAVEFKLLYSGKKLTINPYVRLGYVYNFYDRIATQDSSGLVTLTLIDLDREEQLGGGVTVTYSPTDDWQITGEAYASRFTQRGFFDGLDFGNSFVMRSTQLSVRGKLFAKIRGQATFDYWGGQRYAQFFNDPVVSLRAGLSREFLDGRLRLNLNVRNLFELQRYGGGSQRATYTNTYTRQWQQERWLLTASWDIGKEVRMRRARGRIR